LKTTNVSDVEGVFVVVCLHYQNEQIVTQQNKQQKTQQPRKAANKTKKSKHKQFIN